MLSIIILKTTKYFLLKEITGFCEMLFIYLNFKHIKPNYIMWINI